MSSSEIGVLVEQAKTELVTLNRRWNEDLGEQTSDAYEENLRSIFASLEKVRGEKAITLASSAIHAQAVDDHAYPTNPAYARAARILGEEHARNPYRGLHYLLLLNQAHTLLRLWWFKDTRTEAARRHLELFLEIYTEGRSHPAPFPLPAEDLDRHIRRAKRALLTVTHRLSPSPWVPVRDARTSTSVYLQAAAAIQAGARLRLRGQSEGQVLINSATSGLVYPSERYGLLYLTSEDPLALVDEIPPGSLLLELLSPDGSFVEAPTEADRKHAIYFERWSRRVEDALRPLADELEHVLPQNPTQEQMADLLGRHTRKNPVRTVYFDTGYLHPVRLTQGLGEPLINYAAALHPQKRLPPEEREAAEKILASALEAGVELYLYSNFDPKNTRDPFATLTITGDTHVYDKLPAVLSTRKNDPHITHGIGLPPYGHQIPAIVSAISGGGSPTTAVASLISNLALAGVTGISTEEALLMFFMFGASLLGGTRYVQNLGRQAVSKLEGIRKPQSRVRDPEQAVERFIRGGIA